MSFLSRVKNNLNDPRMNRGHQGKVVVDYKALRELIDHYERLDSEARCRRNEHPVSFDEHLHNAVTSAFHESGKDGHGTLIQVMQTLTPLMKEEEKRQITEDQANA